MLNQFRSLLLLLMVSCSASNKTAKENEWVQIFNGRDLDGWIVKINHHDVGVNFGNTFRAEDGMIKVRYDQYGDFNDQFAHLYYKEPLSYFHLKFDYRFSG